MQSMYNEYRAVTETEKAEVVGLGGLHVVGTGGGGWLGFWGGGGFCLCSASEKGGLRASTRVWQREGRGI
jgi:hypothetical protein